MNHDVPARRDLSILRRVRGGTDNHSWRRTRCQHTFGIARECFRQKAEAIVDPVALRLRRPSG